ncbi:hypothetical protein [Mycobacterium sp. 236(2023)]|uniref:hypothetical protein n=1 Tax=Mycobacterium sp. 236(2023) TaxID=3038163 RepID=UPI00241556F4|nr:hypothetical protein [Mycobacterium sp. 236(2023)]MDG4666968.1 hypothetical protein [Mycobacterium sp. 236(2023)]
MGMVLGLSLTSDDVVWVLVDEADGTVTDHDVIEFHSDTEIAGAAARGAHAIAANGGFDVDRVRLTWSDDVARDGLRLRTRLSCLGFAKVEAVPFGNAMAVMVHPETEPGLALAYGAAVAKVHPSEAVTVPIVRQTPPRRNRSRTRIAVAVLGAAAVAALAGLLLTSGSVPSAEQTATAAASRPQPDPGWVAVPAPSDSAANAVRKIVAAPDQESDEADESEWATPEPARAAEPVALPVVPVPTGVPHMPEGVPHLAAPAPAAPVVLPAPVPEAVPAAPEAVPAAPEAVPAVPEVAPPAPEAVPPTGEPHLPAGQPEPVAPEMTDPSNLFTALP